MLSYSYQQHRAPRSTDERSEGGLSIYRAAEIFKRCRAVFINVPQVRRGHTPGPDRSALHATYPALSMAHAAAGRFALARSPRALFYKGFVLGCRERIGNALRVRLCGASLGSKGLRSACSCPPPAPRHKKRHGPHRALWWGEGSTAGGRTTTRPITARRRAGRPIIIVVVISLILSAQTPPCPSSARGRCPRSPRF